MALIGIFWVFNGSVFGDKTPIDKCSQSVTDLIDSDVTHVDSWERHGHFRTINPQLAYFEYQEVPRGRVLFQLRTQRFLVYLDKKLMNKVTKKAIADYFGFLPSQADWKSDAHYTTDNTQLRRLFDD